MLENSLKKDESYNIYLIEGDKENFLGRGISESLKNLRSLSDFYSIFKNEKNAAPQKPSIPVSLTKNFSKENFEINFQNFLHDSIETFQKKM